jgi:hypothetical protein
MGDECVESVEKGDGRACEHTYGTRQLGVARDFASGKLS